MSSPQTNTKTAELQEVAEAIRSHDRFLVTTHENPDGDALGSLLAAKLALHQLGKDAVMYLAGATPLPHEYGFMRLEGLARRLPEDADERVLFALDCANERRLGPDPGLVERAPLVLDVDHHHDNTRFGDVNAIVSTASSTGEILRDLFRELDVRLTPEIAEALYIALVTDTGRFQYANTTPKALRLAAELVEAGANVHRVFQDVYENVAFAKLKLLARALDRAHVYEGGRLIVSYLERSDFEAAGAEEPFSEGIIDFLRAVEGTEIVALIREPPTQNGPTHRVSLRTRAEDVDVSAIARKSGGGGHRQAAGFSSEASVEEITDFICREFLALTDSGRPQGTAEK
ncbi:MAG: DHH family phosphoesterase [Gaiellaceae bacterium]